MKVKREDKEKAGGAPKRKRAPSSAEHPLAKALKEALTCPITQSLVVRPVVAEDGNTYEHDAIQTWLRSKRRSPMTNAPMGDRLVDSRKSRDLVAAAISAGTVDGADAGAWHVGSARQMACGGIAGGIQGAKTHLEKAPETRETGLLLRAAKLRVEMDDLIREASSAGVEGVDKFLACAAKAPPARPMAAFDKDLVGRRIRIIDDPDLLNTMCETPAPGRDPGMEVGWGDGMKELCGCIFDIEDYDEGMAAYSVAEYWVPYTACILLP